MGGHFLKAASLDSIPAEPRAGRSLFGNTCFPLCPSAAAAVMSFPSHLAVAVLFPPLLPVKLSPWGQSTSAPAEACSRAERLNVSHKLDQ